jgi:hypothetical protein
VRLVQVIRSTDYDCVELVSVEQLVDVREEITNSKSLRECLRLRTVIVADRDKLSSAHAGEQRKMRKLGNRSCSNESNPKVRAHQLTRLTVVPG